MSNNSEKRTSPIPIRGAARHRSASVSSSDSSPTSPPSELPTPLSGPYSSPRVVIPSPGSSPILSYFLAQSPTKTPANATFPLRGKFGPAPVFEEEEATHAARHARRASTTMADRFNTVPSNPTGMIDSGRGTGLLRRLSLSTAPQGFAKTSANRSGSPPMAPPNSVVNPPANGLPYSATKPRRSATLSADSKPRRAPSPMGERMLKGHFDGFN